MNVWLGPVIDLNIAAHMWCTVSVAHLSMKKKSAIKKCNPGCMLSVSISFGKKHLVDSHFYPDI